MIESEKFVYSELPKQVDLARAIELNQKIWRRRDSASQISPTIEISGKFTKPIFDRVLDKFGSYILEDIHKIVRPLVGYSAIPEITTPRGSRYYFPDIGKMRPMGLFVEFGTDWLAKVAYGQDPLRQNFYLGNVNARIGKIDTGSFEDQLLGSLLNAVKSGSIPKRNLTNVFARILISGDLPLFKELGVEFSDGTTETYGSEMSKLKVQDDFTKTVRDMELSRSFSRDTGQTFYPGVITMSGPAQKPVFLAHEYIHSLSFHEDSWVGIPIKRYKLMGGRVLKQNGKT